MCMRLLRRLFWGQGENCVVWRRSNTQKGSGRKIYVSRGCDFAGLGREEGGGRGAVLSLCTASFFLRQRKLFIIIF